VDYQITAKQGGSMAKTEDQLFKKELRRVTLKACRSVEKMIREEPHTIVISIY